STWRKQLCVGAVTTEGSMGRWTHTLFFTAAGALAALHGFGARAGESPRLALEGVPGLEKRVSYSETKIPLGELVATVAAGRGGRLTAAPAVADEPVAVAVQSLPARELLQQLADLLDYQWIRHTPSPTPNSQPPTPTYEIWQDLASKQREEALRRSL